MNIKDKIVQLSIQKSEPIINALKQMDLINRKLLLVFDRDNFVNIISIGDIQRAILNNVQLTFPIEKAIRHDTRIARSKEPFDKIKKVMYDHRIECMPVVNDKNDVVDVYFWEDIFGKEEKRKHDNLNLPVVIMAGGKGARLKPLTNVIPKALIPISEKTIIEEIMDRFLAVGCDNFFVSVNFKAEMIKHYFEQLNNDLYKTHFFQEEKPLGTAGSLFLIKEKIDTTFFVSNCDIVINEDYSEILKYHKENNNELTIVSALKHYPIPYGTIETKMNGVLFSLHEKPELTFQINSGMYILEPHLLNEIPENKFFHITHLIENIQKRKGKVGVFPVSEGSWKDIGEWNEYLKMI